MCLLQSLLLALPQVAPPAPIEPLPSARQLAWHELGYYAFVHFNMNTFTEREWGEGREDPDTFAPTELDCRQWVRIFREAGMRGVILTAKHHDGFCLWPTRQSEHSVAHSAWRDGRGDVVRELADACREGGLALGLYLSPWDRNHPAYGDSPRYDEVFRKELEELCGGEYGELFEVWFDGACGEGPNGKRQIYDWDSYVAVVRRLQPGAVIFSDAGPDVRWVGNEAGWAGETNWCLLRRSELYPGTPRYAELTQGHADGTDWVPAECDVSLRPGWYWHAAEDDAQKSVEQLLAIWDASVGRNAALLLNVPVDRRGLVHEADAARLLEFRRARELVYGEDLARGARIQAGNTRGADASYRPENLLDGDPRTYWACDDGSSGGWLELELERPGYVDRVLLSEAIALGQRVRSFHVSVRTRGVWESVASGTTIGARRILAFPKRRTSAVRIDFSDARGPLALSSLALYCAPPQAFVRAPAQAFVGSQSVELESDCPEADLHYTLDGSEPDASSALYEGPLVLDRSCSLAAVAVLEGRASIVPARVSFTAFRAEDLRPGVHTLVAPRPGVAYRVHEATLQRLSDWPEGEASAAGECASLDLAPRTRAEQVALEFSGFLELPSDGVWTFFLTSDDGSELRLHADLVLANDGLHGSVERSGAFGLRAGLHPFRLRYFNSTGGAALALEVAPPGGLRGPLPAEWLKH